MKTAAKFFSGIIASLGALAVFAGENWPQFRGPTGDNHSDSKGVPLH